MARKQGVGIWTHYRTNERPSADGLEAHFTKDDKAYDAKLYWAPADFSHPDDCNKRAYVVLKVGLLGSMDSFGHYKVQLRTAHYVGDEVPRRNWNKLLEIAQKIDEERLLRLGDDRMFIHEQYVAQGCRYTAYGTYVYPRGSDPQAINEAVVEAFEAWKKGEAHEG